eukprot:1068654-Prymnesium_polylepis.2
MASGCIGRRAWSARATPHTDARLTRALTPSARVCADVCVARSPLVLQQADKAGRALPKRPLRRPVQVALCLCRVRRRVLHTRGAAARRR